jgi:hypothetical protein
VQVFKPSPLWQLTPAALSEHGAREQNLRGTQKTSQLSVE